MNKSKNSTRKPETATVEESVKKSVSKKETKVETPVPVAPVVVEPPTVEETPVTVEKKKIRKGKAAETTEQTAAAETTEQTAAESTTTRKEKVKRDVTRDTVDAEFNELLELIKVGIEGASSGDRKAGNVKVLKTLQKRLKVLRGDCMKISKGKPRTQRTQNTSSGFMKPVRISKEMAKFTGWDVEQPRSRVEVTKFICDYVKSNNLQNEKDRRQILPDAKLCKLLSYDAKKDDKPLTYYYLQKKIQPHFTAIEATNA
jgi:chromatin remodeling complex protein RSC6